MASGKAEKRRSGLRGLFGRRQPEQPTPATPPELVVEPFDKRDYRTLSLLVNGFKAAVGEQPLTQLQWSRLRAAIEREDITYYIARLRGQAVGVCSLCTVYSSYLCAPSGVFEDFYVRPEARGNGVARALVQCACDAVRAAGGATLTVTCAESDVAMYQALGFTVALGNGLSQLL